MQVPVSCDRLSRVESGEVSGEHTASHLNEAHHLMDNAEKELDLIERSRNCSKVWKMKVVIPVLEEQE